jgi:transcriptional regulator with XRE-family HTH domain
MRPEPTLGKRIRRARERKRWTQQRLAAELSVGVRTVNDWENGRSQPKSSIGALEEVLGISLDDDRRDAGLSPAGRAILLDELGPERGAQAIAFIERNEAEPEDRPHATDPGGSRHRRHG